MRQTCRGNQQINLMIARSRINIAKGKFQHKTNNGDCTIILYPRVGVKPRMLESLFFCSFFHFLCSNVPDKKCHKQKRRVLFFTRIKLVAHVLACTRAIARIKWRRLEKVEFFEKTAEKHYLTDSMMNCIGYQQLIYRTH